MFETITFSEAGVVAAITKLKPNFSSGPDNIPPLLFNKLKYSLARPLALLHNQLYTVCLLFSQTLGKVPSLSLFLRKVQQRRSIAQYH